MTIVTNPDQPIKLTPMQILELAFLGTMAKQRAYLAPR